MKEKSKVFYRYTLLNIYSGEFRELKSEVYYKKGTILMREYEVKERQ